MFLSPVRTEEPIDTIFRKNKTSFQYIDCAKSKKNLELKILKDLKFERSCGSLAQISSKFTPRNIRVVLSGKTLNGPPVFHHECDIAFPVQLPEIKMKH